MNKTALTSIAPDIFRKRLLVEGCFGSTIIYTCGPFDEDRAVALVRESIRHDGARGLQSAGPPGPADLRSADLKVRPTYVT